MRPKKRRKILLIEPNYANKFPPIGLMKISTYYRNRGNWDVVFYKGDLTSFVIDRITDKCIAELDLIDNSIDWAIRKDRIFDYIKTRKHDALESIGVDESEFGLLLRGKLDDYKNYYWKGTWKLEPEWDRVCVTTLFTFYWDITVETIKFAKQLVKNPKDLNVGGVLASIQPDELYEATGIKPSVGVLNKPGVFDKGDTQIIDELPLDYSILDEIDYKYPMSNAFYGYMSRGCIRHCAFCAVPTLEPVYTPYISLTERINGIRERYGDQKDLLLMDNNVLASERFEDIINEIKSCGFERGAKFSQPNLLEISVKNLRDGWNDRAYIRKTQSLISEFYETLTNKEESYEVYKILEKYHIKKLITSKKENLLAAYEEIKPYYDKHFHAGLKQRYVDFNQGVDARLFTEEKALLLASIAIRPLRIAFDDIKTRPAYEKAVRWSVSAGIKDFSNYLLYNFKDEPIDLYRRLKINVDLCEELGVSIYSFPMKYHPLYGDNSHDRNYIGEHWNRKYIRAIQAILNSTKGKVGKGVEFFGEAFGHTEDEFFELLEMPETFILYRFFFKWLDEKTGRGTEHWRALWQHCKSKLTKGEWNEVLSTIHANVFNDDIILDFTDSEVRDLLRYYVDSRKDIITPGTELYHLKQEYDQHPTRKLRRKEHHDV
ncbi:MAG: hypothetical protein IKJ81_01810 [Bacteroidales bacterium]|nr:hypothetical protein [Bacteroidales bacterium]